MVTKTIDKVSHDLKAIVREVLAEEKREGSDLVSIKNTLEQLNKKVDALAAK